MDAVIFMAMRLHAMNLIAIKLVCKSRLKLIDLIRERVSLRERMEEIKVKAIWSDSRAVGIAY